MSQIVADLVSRFRQADPTDQQAAVAAILGEWCGGNRAAPLPVADLGVFVPLPPFGGTPPEPSPEDEAEDAYRLAHLDDCRPLSELLDELTVPATTPGGPGKR